MSAKHRIVIAELGLPKDIIPNDLLARCELVLGPDGAGIEEVDLIKLMPNAEAFLFSSRDSISRRVLEAGNRLRIAVKFGAQPTNIDYEAAAELGITIGWTPGANVRSVAEFSVFLTLAALRHVDRALETMAEGGWRNTSHIGLELEDSVIGLIGLGAIGQATSRMFRKLDTRVIAYDPYQKDDTFTAAGAEKVSLEDIFRQSDVISLHCHFSEETHNILDGAAFQMMKPAVVVVNTARGGLIEEPALIDALNSGRIGAAALDVFFDEPLPADHPFRSMRNVIATPHVAARSLKAIRRERFWGLRGALAFLDGEPVERMVLKYPGTE